MTETTKHGPDAITQVLLDRLDQIFPVIGDVEAERERSEQAMAALETWVRQTLERIEENVAANLSSLMHQRDATIERLESTLMYLARGENGVTEDGKNAHEIARKYVAIERLTANLRIELMRKNPEVDPVVDLLQALFGGQQICTLCGIEHLGIEREAHYTTEPCGKTALWFGSLQALLRLHVRAVDDSSVSVSAMVEQLCAERKKMIEERAILVSALEDITTADETSTVAGAVAIAQKALGLVS